VICGLQRRTFCPITIPVGRAPVATHELHADWIFAVCPSAPGLYFIGLPFLYSINSSLVVGVGRDATYLADQIASRATANRPS
jgi:hypothetical protein